MASPAEGRAPSLRMPIVGVRPTLFLRRGLDFIAMTLKRQILHQGAVYQCPQNWLYRRMPAFTTLGQKDISFSYHFFASKAEI